MNLRHSTVLPPESGPPAPPWRMTVASPAPGRVDVSIEGALDLAAARRVIEVLAHASAADVHVDLSAARRIEDTALAHLADALHGSAARVAIGGLGLHHQRLLRLLGRVQMFEAENR